jgi:hypothetical protein
VTAYTHTYTSYLIGSGELQVKGGSITLDTGQYPHVQADLTIGPTTVAFYNALDPRLRPRVQIGAHTGTDFTTGFRTFDLGVRSRPISYLNGDYQLTLASDEALVADISPLADDITTQAYTSGRAVVGYVLSKIGATLAAGPDFTIPVDADSDALIWKAGDNGMQFLRPVLETSGYRLVCDEQRVWTLRDENYTAPGFLSLRVGVNLIDATEDIDRDAQLWFDAAVTRYKWTDAAGVAHEAVDGFAWTYPPTLVKTFDKAIPFQGYGFSEYVVRRAQGRGREVSATAVADWTATAEQAVEVVLPVTPLQAGRIISIAFDLDSDRMTVTTRTHDTLTGTIELLVGTIDALVGTIDAL